MTTLREIAEDPRKALSNLEKRLGAEPGDLLRDMERLGPPGSEWAKHIPYRVAASYYDDERARTAYEGHVDSCEYCKTMLDSLHPTAVEAADFSSRAKGFHARSPRKWHVKVAPYAWAASVVLCSFSAWALLRSRPEFASVQPGPALALDNTSVSPAIQGWVTDVKIGGTTDAENPAVPSAAASIRAGNPVHLVAEIQGAPNRTPISVIWIGPNNQVVRRETNWTREGERSVAFAATDTSAWKSGNYRAEPGSRTTR